MMSGIAEETFDVEALRATLYGDALSSSAQKTGKNLLIVSALTLITTTFDVGVRSTPLLPLDFSNNPHSLVTFLAIANACLLAMYILKATTDLVYASEKWAEAKKSIQIEKLQHALRDARRIDDAISDAEPDPRGYPIIDEWWEDYSDIREQGLKTIRRLEARIADRRVPIMLRWFNLWFFCGLPAVSGALALVHTWGFAVEFVRTVVAL